MYLVGDIGGTHIRLGVSRDRQSLLSYVILDNPGRIDEAIELIKTQSLNLCGGEAPKAAIFGVAGPLDLGHTKLTKAPHLEGWEGKPLKDLLTEALNTIVTLENDAALEAIGEAVAGAGKGNKVVGYLTVGTGVGGAKVVDGVLDPPAHNFEPGNQIIDGEHTLEGLISGEALRKAYNLNSEDIHDPKVWDEVARNLSIGINNLIVSWAPDIMVLGGSVLKSVELSRVKNYLREELEIFSPPPIVLSNLGDLAGLYGGLVVLWQVNS